VTAGALTVIVPAVTVNATLETCRPPDMGVAHDGYPVAFRFVFALMVTGVGVAYPPAAGPVVAAVGYTGNWGDPVTGRHPPRRSVVTSAADGFLAGERR
jgi:hypothetical protein